MIIRGTTPYHSFILPFAASEIQELWISYMQNGKVIFTKDNHMGSVVTLTDIDESMVNGFVTDYNQGDSFSSNDANQEEEEQISYSEATVHLSQEDTLSFTFYPAAEKNIIVIQVRVLTMNGEAYASLPERERLFGVFPEGVITSK